MLRTLWMLVALTVGFGVSQSAALDWKEYRPEGAGYAVEMPGEWKVQSQDVPTNAGVIKVNIAVVDAGAIAFVTMYSRYPESTIQGQTVSVLFDGARNGAVANVKGKLRSERDVTVSGFPGREIIIDGPTGGIVIMRFFLSGSTLIQAIVGGKSGVETDPDTRRFLDSLRGVESGN